MASPYVFRQEGDTENPVLARLLGLGITQGLPVIVKQNHSGVRVGGISILCEGARRQGDTECEGIIQFSFRGFVIPEYSGAVRNWRFHSGKMTKVPVYTTVTADHTTDKLLATAHGLENSATGETYKIIAEGPHTPTIPSVPEGLIDESQVYYIVNKTANDFQLSLTVGGSAETFTDNGNGTLRVYRANAGFDDPDQGRPEFFPNLDFCFSGITYVEWLLPEQYTGVDDNASELRVIMKGKKLRNFTFDPVTEIITLDDVDDAEYSTNPALEAIDVIVNDGRIPLTFDHLGVTVPRLRGSYFEEYEERCDGLIEWTGGGNSNIEGIIEFETEVGVTFEYSPESGALLKEVDTGNGCVYTREILVTETDFYMKFTVQAGQLKFGFHTNNTDDNPTSTQGVLFATSGIIYSTLGMTVTAIGSWSPGDEIKIASENRVLRVYQSEIPVSIPIALLPSASLYGYVHGSTGTLASTSSGIFSPVVEEAETREIKRFTSHVVFTSPTIVSEALSGIVSRTPGCDIQDVNGAMKVLTVPNRTPVMTLHHDPESEEKSNLIDVSLVPMPPEERSNFYRALLRDTDTLYLKQVPVFVNRDELRAQFDVLLDSGLKNYGVMNQSEGQRILETETRIATDLKIRALAQATFESYKLAVGDVFLLADNIPNWSIEDAVEFMVEEETSRFDKVPTRDVRIRLHSDDYYSDDYHGEAQPTLPAVDNSHLGPAPTALDLTLEQTTEATAEGTTVSSITGTVTFQPFAGQRGRVWWFKPDAAEYVRTPIILTPDSISQAIFELFPAAVGEHLIRVVTENSSGYSYPFDSHIEEEIDIASSIPFARSEFAAGLAPICLGRSMSDLTTIGTTLENLYTLEIPADILHTDGDTVSAKFALVFAANTNGKRVVLSFGGSDVIDTGNLTDNGVACDLEFTMIRVDADTIRSVAVFRRNSVTDLVSFAEITSLDLEHTDLELILKARTIDAAGDLTAKFGMVNYQPI